MCFNICRHRSARHCSKAEQQIPVALGEHQLRQELIIAVIAAAPCQGEGSTTETDQGCESGVDSETENGCTNTPLVLKGGKKSLFLEGDKDTHSHSSAGLSVWLGHQESDK